MVGLGYENLLPSLDNCRSLYGPAGLRQPQTSDPGALPIAAERLYEELRGAGSFGCRGRCGLAVLAHGGRRPCASPALWRVVAAGSKPSVPSAGRVRLPRP